MNTAIALNQSFNSTSITYHYRGVSYEGTTSRLEGIDHTLGRYRGVQAKIMLPIGNAQQNHQRRYRGIVY
jgi:hypothetical protein